MTDPLNVVGASAGFDILTGEPVRRSRAIVFRKALFASTAIVGVALANPASAQVTKGGNGGTSDGPNIPNSTPGGAGGNSGVAGGSGASYPGNGISFDGSGGGGGGAGAAGGSGGSGHDSANYPAAAGGAAGAAGQAGGNGTTGTGNANTQGYGAGGGGGGGGGTALTTSGTVTITLNAIGGNGGNGGNSVEGGGGGGGAGGDGIDATGTAVVTVNAGVTVQGGAGGAGGNTQTFSQGGQGGGGGVGFFGNGTLINAGVIKTGIAGASGTGPFVSSAAAPGSAAVVGSNLAVTNSGSIVGNAGGDAITYTGGTNSLTLSSGGSAGSLTGGIGITGSLSIDPGTAAGTAVTLNSVVHDDAGGAGSVTKTGAGTLILSGANSYTGGTTISNGVLQVTTATLPAGTITDNATLAFVQSASGTFTSGISGSGVVTVAGVGVANAVTFAGALTNAGGIVVNDASTVRLTGSLNTGGNVAFNSTAGATLNNQGTIVAAVGGVPGTVSFSAGGTVINGTAGQSASISGAYSALYYTGGALGVTNFGVVSAGSYAIVAQGGNSANPTSLALTNTGTIVGGAVGVVANDQTTSNSITNSGIIQAGSYNAGTITAGSGGSALAVRGTTTVTNNAGGRIIGGTGTTSGDHYGIQTLSGGSLTLTNAATAQIVGGYTGVDVSGVATITNSGLIGTGTVSTGGVYTGGGSGSAISTALAATVTNNAGATIQGYNGIKAAGTLTLTNAGAIVSMNVDNITTSAGGTITNGDATFTAAQNSASRIEGKQTAIAGSGATLLTVNNYGRIIGDDFGGAGQNNSGAFTLNNFASGVVAANGGYNGTYAYGAFAGGGVLTVTNAGLITSKQYAVYGSNSSDTVTNSGTIEGGVYNVATGAVTAGGVNAVNLTAGGTVTNNAGGLIVAGTDGINSNGALILTNAATAKIVGNAGGVFANGTATVSNAGTIGTGTVAANGTFTVGGAGFGVQAGSIAITNSGTIQASGASIYQTGTTGALNLVNTGTIGGTARTVDPDDTIVAAGTAQILNGGTISTPNFYAVDMQNGGTLTNAAAGQIAAGNAGDRYAVFVTNASATINNYGSLTSTGNATSNGAGTNDAISRGIISDNHATTINLFAGSTTGSIATGSANDTLTLYNGRGAAGTATTQGYTDAVSGAPATVTLQNAGTLAAAIVGAVNLGGGTNTLTLAGTGDGLANGALGTLDVTSLTNVTKLVKQDSGTWMVTGTPNGTPTTPNPNLNFSGGVSVLAGTLAVETGSNSYSSNALGSGAVAISGGATVRYDNPYATGSLGPSGGQIYVSSNQVTGTGTLAFTGGAGSQTVLDHRNSSTEDVALSAGGLIAVQSGAVLAIGTGVFAGNQARLDIASGASFDGASDVITIDALTGGGTYTGTGTLQIGVAGGSGTFTGTIANEASALSVTKTGAGTETLSGALTYTGGTTITGGTLRVQNTTIATGTTQINSGATLDLANTNTATASPTVLIGPSTLTGTGTLVKSGTGSTSLGGSGNVNVNLSQGALIDIQAGLFAGSSSFQGIWTNNQASLNVASGATFNGVEGAIFVDALTGSGTVLGGQGGVARTTTVGVANGSGTFAGVLGDYAGDPNSKLALTKTGTGTQTLSGVNTYTGATTISGGTLALSGSGSIATSANVTNNASFDISGRTSGTTVNQLSGTGTVVLGANTLTANETSAQTMSGVISGSGGFTKSGASNLTLSGANTYTGATTIAAGTLALTGTGSIASSSGVVDSGIFDISGHTGNAFIRTLSGAGNVTLGQNALVLGTASGTFSGVISGTIGSGFYGLQINGAETLSGVNTYTGWTSVAQGSTLTLSAGGSIAASQTIGLFGTLDISAHTGGVTVQNVNDQSSTPASIVLGANTLTTNFLTLYGTASGTGGLTLANGYSATLYGANTYSGTTTIGTNANVALGTNGSITSSAVANGGTFDISSHSGGTSIAGLSGTGRVTLGANTLTLTSGGTFAGVASGTGGLNVAAGDEVLTGNSTYTGTTMVAGGNLTLGNGGTTGSVAGPIALTSGTLTINRSNAVTLTGAISGGGSLVQAGSGTTTLSGTNNYTGTTTVNAGTLALSGGAAIADNSAVIVNAGTLGLLSSETIGSLSGSGAVALGANTLTLGGTNASTTFSGTASGTGGILKTGSGTLTLSGANGFTGTLEIAGGTVAYGANNVLADTATVTVDAGTIFNLAGFSDRIGTLNLYGTLSNGGLLTATTYNAYAGSTINQAIGTTGTLNVLGNTTLNNATNAAPVNIDVGTLTLGSAELLSNTGAVNIANGGTLVLGGNETIGSLADTSYMGSTGGGTVTLGANTLTIGGANTSTGFSGAMTSTTGGSLVKAGTGTQTLTGANSYNGTTTISGGTLQGTSTSISGSSIVDNATLAYNQAASATVAQNISGSGTVTVTGLAASAALTFAGTGSQTGGFAVTDGSMIAFTGTNGGGSTEVTLQDAGTLVNTGTITGTTNGVLAAAASGTTTVLNGATGTIAGASYGLQSGGAGVLALTNYGTITGPVSALSTGANVLSLRAGSTTGAVTTGSGNDMLSLYTGFVATNPVVDATTGLTLRAAGTYGAATLGAIDLGGGNNVLNLRGMGDGTTANGAASSIDLSGVANVGTITKQDAGTWTLTGAVADPVTSAATINAGIGGAPGSGGLLVFAGSSLTGTINVNGATIRATAAGAFGTATINAIDPTIQYAATGTYANPIVLQSTNPTSDPTTLQTFGVGISATLSGTITELNAPQPLVFSSINTDGTPGTGMFVLTNTGNAWSGVTTVGAGTTLRGTTASLSGASFTDNGVLNFSQAAAGTSARAISGSGTVVIDGGGPVTLTGAITASGGVQVGANTTATLSNVSGSGNTTVFLSGDNAVLNVAQGGTVSATNGGAVFGTAQNGTVNNAGTITSTGNFTAVYFNPNLGTATVTNTGNVNAFGSAVYAGTGTTLALTNSGTLSSTNRPAVLTNGAATITNGAAGTMTGFFGVYANGNLTLANAGQITAVGSGGNAVTANSGGTIVNSGTLNATTAGGWGVQMSGAGSVDNQGTVNADSGLVSTVATGVSFTNEGTITAAQNGVWGYGTAVTLTNSGMINGGGATGTAGVRAEAAGSSITNSGTIAVSSTAAVGVYMTGGTLTNQSGGTISGGAVAGGGYGTAVQLAGAGNMLSLLAGSTVNGLIDASNTTDGSNSYTFSGNLNGGFIGGSGNDTVTLLTPVTVNGTLDGGAGTDTLVLDGTTAGTLGSAQVVNVENGVKQGSGTWTVTGTTAASPTAFAINAGTLAVAGGNALADNGAVTIASGATLQLNASETIGSLAGAGNVTLGANTLTTGGLNASPTFSGVASGTGGLTKVGTGTLTLAGANSYTGATTVSAGTLALGATNAIGAGSAVTVASGATLNLATYNDTVASLALAGTLAGTGTLTAATYTLNNAVVNANLGAGTLTQAGGTSALKGTAAAATVNVNGGTLSLGANDRLADNATVLIATGAALNMATFTDTVGLVGIAGTLNGTGTLTAAEYDLSGSTVNANLGTGNVFQQAGTSTLNGTSAATSVNVIGGTLALGASNRLADAAAVAVGTGATLALGANSDTVGSFALSGTLAGTGTLTAATYTLNNAAVNANLGTGTLVQAGGTSTLGGTAAATSVNVTGGTLTLGASNRLATTAAVQIASAATFNLANFNQSVATVGGNGTLALGSGTLTVGGGNADFGYAGTISGSGDVTKTGTGTFTLVGTDSMTGRLNVNAGTLAFGATSAGSARIQGGTLTGGGTFAGNLLLASGTLSPGVAGQPIGTIQVGSFTGTGGTFAVDFTGSAGGFTADRLAVTGTAALSGGVVVPTAAEPSANYRMTNEYRILQAGTLSGTFGNGTTFAQVAGSSDLYWRLRYDLVPNAVLLEVRKVVDFTAGLGSGASGNQLGVAAALNGSALTGSDSYIAALDAITALTPAQRAATYDSIGGEAVADITTSLSLVGNRFSDMLRERLTNGSAINDGNIAAIAAVIDGTAGSGALRQAAPVLGNASRLVDDGAHINAWLQGYGASGSIDGRAGTAKVTDFAAGAAAGVELQGETFKIGVAGTITDLEANARARLSRNTGTIYQGGGYVAYDNGATFANAIGSYFGGTVNTARSVFVGTTLFGKATGHAASTGYSASASLGHRFDLGNGVLVTPQVSGEAVHVTRNAFTETGAGVLSLAVARETRDLYSAIGELRVSHKGVTAGGGVVEPYASIGVRVNLGDLDTLSAMRFTGAPTGTGAFTIAGAQLAKTSALFTGGINAHPSDTVTLGVELGGSYARQQREGRVSMNVKIGF